MLRLCDIMTTDVITVDPNLTIREAMDVLTSNRISGAPVIAGDEVVGVVSASDLLMFAAALPGVPTERDVRSDLLDALQDDAPGDADLPDGVSGATFFTDLWDDAGATVVERMAVPASAEWNSLEEHTVSDAMTRAPIHSLTPETVVTIAADYMRRLQIHRVLVMKGRQLTGVVTTTDITNAVADGKLTARTFVFDRPVNRRGTQRWGGRR
jgi:CBS domain-containing protein